MAYELDLESGVRRSLPRAYGETLKKARAALAAHSTSSEPVHEARTGVKRARALLRLVRQDIERSRFRRENGALRGAGRALSAVRDAVILVDALDGLLDRASDEDRSSLAPLRAALVDQRDRRLMESGDLIAEAERALDGARDRASHLTLGHRGWKALAPGLERAYRRGRDRFDHAYATGRDEDFHALRKAVKDLAHQARFLRPIDEPALRAEEDRLKTLGRLLGDDHDLTVLTAIERRSGEDADPAVTERLGTLAAKRKVELREEAWKIAERFFTEAEGPRLARLEAAYRGARARTAAPAQPSA
jgi:CHAD domain-containing protein